MTELYESPMIAVGNEADMAIGSVTMEGVPEALIVEHAVVASMSEKIRMLPRKSVEEYRF